MKPFSSTPIAKAFTHPERDLILKYVVLMCSKDSEMNAIENLEERKKAAMEKSRWRGTEDETLQEQINELIFHYLSYYQANNDFSLLLSREGLFAEMLKAIREPIVTIKDEDKILKAIKIKGETDNLLEQLNGRIKELRKSLFGPLIDVAQPRINKILTPESRLKK